MWLCRYSELCASRPVGGRLLSTLPVPYCMSQKLIGTYSVLRNDWDMKLLVSWDWKRLGNFSDAKHLGTYYNLKTPFWESTKVAMFPNIRMAHRSWGCPLYWDLHQFRWAFFVFNNSSCFLVVDFQQCKSVHNLKDEHQTCKYSFRWFYIPDVTWPCVPPRNSIHATIVIGLFQTQTHTQQKK